jgi:hypothetical protein
MFDGIDPLSGIIPAKAGVQGRLRRSLSLWVPAFAGTTHGVRTGPPIIR